MAAPLFPMQPHTRKMRGQEISTSRNHVPTHCWPSIWRRRSDSPTKKSKSMPVHRVVELHGFEQQHQVTNSTSVLNSNSCIRKDMQGLPPLPAGMSVVYSVAARRTRLAAKIFSQGFAAVLVPRQSSLGGQEKTTKRPTASAYPVMFLLPFLTNGAPHGSSSL
ncbi:hypothetical protein Landi51_00652 [Colletotrichum acutatum]